MKVTFHVDPEIGTARGEVARDVRPMRTAVIERVNWDRASDRGDDIREGETAEVSLHPAIARHDDGDPPGVVLHIGSSHGLLTNREVACERRNVL